MYRFISVIINNLKLKLIIKKKIFVYKVIVFYKFIIKKTKKILLSLFSSFKIIISKMEINNKFKPYVPEFKILNVLILGLFYISILFIIFVKSDVLVIYGLDEIYKQFCLFISLLIYKINLLKTLYNVFMKVFDFWMDWFRFTNFFNIYVPESLKDPGMMNFFKKNVQYWNSLEIGWFSFSFYMKNLRGNLEWDLYYITKLWFIRKKNFSEFFEIYTKDLGFLKNLGFLKINEKEEKENLLSFFQKIFYIFNNIIIRSPYYINRKLRRLKWKFHHKFLCKLDLSYVKSLQFVSIFISIFIFNFLILLQCIIDLIIYIFQDLYIYILYINKLRFDLFFDFYLYLKQYILYNIYYFINTNLFDNNLFILLQSFIAYIIEYNKYIFVIFKNFIIDLFYSNSRNSSILQGFKNKLYYRGNLILEYYKEINFEKKLKLWSHLPKNYKILDFKNKYYTLQAIMWNSHYPTENRYNIFKRKKRRKIFEDFLFFDKSKINFVIKWDPISNSKHHSFMMKILGNTCLYIIFVLNLIISFFVLGTFWYANLKKDINYIYLEKTYSLMTILMMRKNNLLDYISQYWEILVIKNVFEEFYDDEDFDKDIDWRIPTFDLTVSDNLLAFENFYSQKINNIKLNENTYSKYLEMELKSEGANRTETFLNNFDLQIYSLSKIKNVLYNKIKLKGYILYLSYLCRFMIQKINVALYLDKYMTFIYLNINIIHNYYVTKNHNLLNLHFTEWTNKQIYYDLQYNNNFNYIILLSHAFNNFRYKHMIQIPFIIMNVDKKKILFFDFLGKEIFQWKYNDSNYKNVNKQLYYINKVYQLKITEKDLNPYINDFKNRYILSEPPFVFNLFRMIIYIFILSCIYAMSNGLMELDFIYNIKETIGIIFYYIFLPMQTFTKYLAISIFLIKKFWRKLTHIYYINTSLLTGASDILYDYSFLTYYNLIWLWDTQTVIISNIFISLKIKKYYEFIFDTSELMESQSPDHIIRQLISLQKLKLYFRDRTKNKNKTFIINKIPIIIYSYYKKLIPNTIKRIYLMFKESSRFLFGFDTLYHIKDAKKKIRVNVFTYKWKHKLKIIFEIEYSIRKKIKLFINENSFINSFIFRNKSTWNDVEKEKFEDILTKWEHIDDDILNTSLNLKTKQNKTKKENNMKYVLNKFNKLSIAKYVASFKTWLFESDLIKVENKREKENRKKVFGWLTKNPFKYRERYIHYFIQQYTQRPYILNKKEKRNPTLRVWDYRNLKNKTDKFNLLLKYYLQEVLWRMRYIHHKKFFNVYQGKKKFHETEKKYKELFDKIYQDKYKEDKPIRIKLRHFRYKNSKWSNFEFTNKYFYDFKLRRLKEFEGSFISKLFWRFLRYKKDFDLRMGNHPVKPFDDFFEDQGLFWIYKKWATKNNIDKIINVADNQYQSKWTEKRYLKFIERRNHITRIVIWRKLKKMLLRTWIWNQAVRTNFIHVVNKHFWERTTYLRTLKKKELELKEEQIQTKQLEIMKNKLEKLKNKIKNIIKNKDGKI